MKTVFLILLVLLSIAGQGCLLFTDGDDAGNQKEISLARVRFEKDTLITQSMIHVTLTDESFQYPFEPNDFNSTPYWSTPEVQISTQGELTMDFRISTGEGGIVSAGRMRWPLKPDSHWLLSLNRSTHRRVYHVPTGYKSFPIVDSRYRASEQDSIFIVWHVNYISDPVQY